MTDKEYPGVHYIHEKALLAVYPFALRKKRCP